MRNIFAFIRRYFHLLTFLLLQAFCIFLIGHYSRYHNAIFTGTANRLTGTVNKQYNTIEYYFDLKRTNDSLVKANERLLNKLKENFALPDSSVRTITDTIRIDSIEQYRTHTYLSAKVVSNSVSMQNNFIVLYGPNVKKFSIGMGIIDMNNAVVGIVTDVNGDYAVVMGMLHKDSHISARLFKSGEAGILNWDGKQPNMITLKNIPKGTVVAKGDSIVTSGLSTTFPKGLMVGLVDAIYEESGTSNLNIKLKTAANFYKLEYVYAIVNNQAAPVKQLLDKANKQL